MTQATHLLPEDLQRNNETLLSRKHLIKWIDRAMRADPEIDRFVQDGKARITAWLQPTYFDSKQVRLDQLRQMDLEQLVRDIFIGVAFIEQDELFVSATSKLAKHLSFDDKRDSIRTVAEMCAVLCWTGAFTLHKEEEADSLRVQGNLKLPKDLQEAIRRSLYLPPMVCKPNIVKSNYESAYLLHNDSLILGKGNAHSGDICLDVINTQNQIALQLDLEFLSSVEEEPTFELDSVAKLNNWQQFKWDSYNLYEMIARQGNTFWLTNKPDKRGRGYAQGYHITTQGSPFKKAMIELKHEELVTGVPTTEN